MINATETKLLVALLQQIDKYGIDVFSSLIQKLGHDDPIIDLSTLRKVATNTTKRTYVTNDWEEKTIALIKAQRHDKSEKIKTFLEIMNSTGPFKKLSDLQSFINKFEVIKKKFKSRAEANYSIAEYLTKVDDKTIDSIFFSLEEEIKNDDRSLKAWSNVIFKGKIER